MISKAIMAKGYDHKRGRGSENGNLRSVLNVITKGRKGGSENPKS